MKITYKNGKTRYYDINGTEIHAGDFVIINGKMEEVYETEDGDLGIDATNPAWIREGRAVACEFGVYPFSTADEPLIFAQ